MEASGQPCPGCSTPRRKSHNTSLGHFGEDVKFLPLLGVEPQILEMGLFQSAVKEAFRSIKLL
jgi:hypothetical protein